MSDQVLASSLAILSSTDALAAEQWASEWLGLSWLGAGLGDRQPEQELCLEVVGRASARPTPQALAAVAALRRVAPPSETAMLDATIAILRGKVLGPAWLESAPFAPVRAWCAVDPWDSERVLFVEYASADRAATPHTVMAHILEPGGTYVIQLGVLQADATQHWAELHAGDPVPFPVAEAEVATVLTDLASAMRRTDMVWPRNDEPDFVEGRALVWSRCRDFLPALGGLDDDEPENGPDELVDSFLEQAKDRFDQDDIEAVGTVARLLGDYSYGYLSRGPLTWSPGSVGLFLTDWLPRKAFLDDADRRVLPATLRQWVHFVLKRRGVSEEWIGPVLAAVDEHLPAFEAAIDDDAGWGPAKQIAAELQARGVDVTDKRAVDDVVRELNAARLARRLLE